MAEITRRRTGELLRELFNILMAEPDGVQASAALQALAGRVTLTPYRPAHRLRRHEREEDRAALDQAAQDHRPLAVAQVRRCQPLIRR